MAAGVAFSDLAGLEDGQPQPAAAAVVAVRRHLVRPVTVTVAGDPLTGVGLALAIADARSEPVAVVDTRPEQQVARLVGGRPYGDLAAVAAMLDRLRGDPGHRFAAAGPVDVFDASKVSSPADLIEAHAVICRTYPVVVMVGDSDTALGMADVIVYPLRWTATSVARVTAALDAAHRGGEEPLRRAIIAPLTGDADPGMESTARRWLAAFPICPIPADPAAATPPVSWHGLRELTRTAYTRLAGHVLAATPQPQ